MGKQKKKNSDKPSKQLLCLRCGNELPWIRNKDYIFCPFCNYKNDKGELGCLKNYGKQSRRGGKTA